MLQKVIQYQNKIMDSRPSDYAGDQLAWEMNVLYWFLKIIEQDEIDIELIRSLTSSISKS